MPKTLKKVLWWVDGWCVNVNFILRFWPKLRPWYIGYDQADQFNNLINL